MNALIFIWAFVLLLGASAVGGLIWAIGSGQFQSSRDAAESIFDLQEPVGKVTDAYPDDQSTGPSS